MGRRRERTVESRSESLSAPTSRLASPSRTTPASPGGSALLRLQPTIGNQAVLRLATGRLLRPKPTVGPVGGAHTGRRPLVHEPTQTKQHGPARPRLQRVFAPEFFMSSTVRYHFPNGGQGYQTSQVAEKMRREVGEDGTGGQDTGYGYKTKPVYHKSSGTPAGTSVSAFFTVHPTYVVAMGEHNTTTSYDLYWCNPDVTRWAAGNTVAINTGDRVDITSKAAVRGVLAQQGYTTAFNRVGGQLGWTGGTAQGNKFTTDKRLKVENVTVYALSGEGLKGLWERTADSKDTVLANTFH